MYAFLFSGTDSTGGHVLEMVGSVSASGGAFSNLALDYDDAGATGSNLTGGTGAFTSTDGNGRGTASFSISTYSLNNVFYMVNSTRSNLCLDRSHFNQSNRQWRSFGNRRSFLGRQPIG